MSVAIRPSPSAIIPARLDPAPVSERRLQWVFAPTLASLCVHLMLLITLGLLMVDRHAVSEVVHLIGSRDTDTSSLDQLEVEELDRRATGMEGLRLEASQIVGEPAGDIPSQATVGGGEVDVDRADLTPAMTRSSSGADGVSFFGAVAKGKKFVFVVDNSNSMGGRAVGKVTKFERAKAEMLESISKLGADKSFYMVFFNAHPTRMLDPNPPTTFLTNSSDNYYKVYYWLMGLELARQTRGKEALQIALDLKPDAIYLLGDGAFTDDTEAALKVMNTRKVPIHTLYIRPGNKKIDRGYEAMERIAAAHGGSFSIVD